MTSSLIENEAETYKMTISILPKFLTLKWNILRTIWRIDFGNGSIFLRFYALSFELNFFFRPEVPFENINIIYIALKHIIWRF